MVLSSTLSPCQHPDTQLLPTELPPPMRVQGKGEVAGAAEAGAGRGQARRIHGPCFAGVLPCFRAQLEWESLFA
eukprot:4472605-Alexandrium_andersonii.AAC.1